MYVESHAGSLVVATSAVYGFLCTESTPGRNVSRGSSLRFSSAGFRLLLFSNGSVMNTLTCHLS